MWLATQSPHRHFCFCRWKEASSGLLSDWLRAWILAILQRLEHRFHFSGAPWIIVDVLLSWALKDPQI